MTVQDLRNQLKEIGLEGLEKVCMVFREKKTFLFWLAHEPHFNAISFVKNRGFSVWAA